MSSCSVPMLHKWNDALFFERKPGFTLASVRTFSMCLYSHILQLTQAMFYNMVRVMGVFVCVYVMTGCGLPVLQSIQYTE